MSDERLAAGADGCKAGWIVVVVDVSGCAVRRCFVAPTFSELLLQTTECTAVAIDIPIGLPRRLAAAGRPVDLEARALLSPNRRNSVFSAPPRGVLQARSYEEANELHRENSDGGQGMSRQAFGLLQKIADVDDLMTPRLQKRVVETHPELSFMELNDGSPLSFPKLSAPGMLARVRLLTRVGCLTGLEEEAGQVAAGAKPDDVLDAAAAAWTGARFVRGEAIRIPDDPGVDQRGLRMEMWR
jgi:predicted RNase H-like nuclease